MLIAAIGRCCSLAEKLNYIACNVAFCDLLLGITLIVNIGLIQEHPVLAEIHPNACTIIGLLELLPVVTCLIFLTLVDTDRFLAVCVPTVYPDLWTTKRVSGTCIGIWVFSIVLSAVAFAFKTEPDVVICDVLALPRGFLLLSTLVHIVPCSIINTVLYLKIKHMLKVHQRKIQVTNTLTYTNLVDDTQLARLFYMLVVISLVAWAPFVISIILWFCDLDLSALPPAVRICFLLGHLAGLKLFVYVAESTTYRMAIKKLFKPPQRQESSHNIRGSSGVQ